MKAKLILIAIGGSLLLAGPALRAEDTNKPAGPPRKHGSRENNLLPPPLVEKLNLTEDQKAKLKVIEENWDKTRQEYMDAHKADADAARAAAEEAKQSGDPAKKKEAGEKRRQLVAGLRTQRQQYVDQVRSLLSEEQKKIWEEAKKQRGQGPKKGRTPEKEADDEKDEAPK